MTATEIPPLRRDTRVHAWVAAAGISQLGDMAWYIGLAWSAAQVAGPAGAGLVMGAGTMLWAVARVGAIKPAPVGV